MNLKFGGINDGWMGRGPIILLQHSSCSQTDVNMLTCISGLLMRGLPLTIWFGEI
jgi:hypothetical protein